MSLPPPTPAPAAAPRRSRGWWGLLLAGTLLPGLLLLALGSWALVQSRAQHEKRAELLTQNLAGALDRSLSANIEKIDLALASIVEHLERQLVGGGLDLAAASAHIRSQVARRTELEGVRVTDANGIGILGPDLEGRPPLSFADREWFQAQRDRADAGLYMSRPLVSKLHGQWIMSFSRRYRLPSGEFAGAVSAAVPLSYFEHELKALDLGPHGVVVLRHADLAQIVRYPVQKPEDGTVGTRRVSAQLQALVAEGQRAGTYHAEVTADGVARTNSFRRLSVAPLLIIVGLSRQDYLADWRGEVRVVAGIFAALLALYGAGAVLLLRLRVQQRAARRRIDLLAKVFEHSGEAILVTDARNRIVEINPAFERQTGYSAAEVLGTNPRSLCSGRTRPADFRAAWEAVKENDFWRGEFWGRTKQGREIPAWVTMTAVRDAEGAITHHIASSVDMSEMKAAQAKIQHLAHHDSLTRLPNRASLLHWLGQALPVARRENQHLALLVIDLDRFKNINDTLGHHVGDALLVEVAQRLRAMVRAADVVARLGGDEFALVLRGEGGDGGRMAGVVADKVLAVLGRPMHAAGQELHVTPSIGIALAPADGEDAETLMRNADAAMYHAKSSGRNNRQFYAPAMNAASAERLALEAGLRHAIARGELFLHYQPQLELGSGRIVGLEALVRWRHPERGLVPPLKFIPIAEDTGLIESIGLWVLDQALAQAAQWRLAGHETLRVAVNLSAQQLRGEGFAAMVALALHRHGLPGNALELEVTESAAMENPARTAALLRQLRELGVALAIDDFGTGYSSLAYLKQLPLSCLKLDRSFVMDIEKDPNDAAICKATIQLAHSLGLGVVAEGVETQAQLEYLRGLGCDTVQGYLISRPAAAADCEALLQRHRETAAAPEALAEAPV